MPQDADVIIIGGAVAGLALANALGHQGVRTLVLEKGPERDNSTRGDILHPPTLRFLERWGVLDGLHQIGALPITRIAVSHRDLGRLATYEVPRQADGPAGQSLAVPHDRIEAVMKETAARWSDVSIERALAVGIERDESGRVVGVQTRIGDHQKVYRASLVVGCDGMNSMVRRRLGIAVEQARYPHRFAFVTAEGTTDPPAAMHFHLSDRVILVANRPRGEIRIGIRFEHGEGRTLFQPAHPALHDFIRSRVPPLESVRFSDSEVHIYPIVRQLAERFWAPGAALVGDAAHTTHPAGATGMNLAITGASRLADLVRPVLGNGGATPVSAAALDTALAAFDRERRPAVAAAIAENHRQAMRIWNRGVEADPHAYAAAADPSAGWGVGGAGWGQNPAALGTER